MLLYGSIILACLGFVACQEHDYNVDEHYEDGPSHPDYSKYYHTDTSAPLTSLDKSDPNAPSGFVSPIDFGSFFSPQHFDLGSASNPQAIKSDATNEPEKNGFVNSADFASGFGDVKDPFNKDFFEQAQTVKSETEADDKEEYESKPGPNYISYKIPPKTKNYKKKIEREELGDKDEYNHEFAAENTDTVPNKKINYAFKVDHKPLPKDDELAALTASPTPFIPQYYSKYANPQQLTPYQQYSFQPAQDSYGLKTSFVSNIQSTPAPYNPTYQKIAAAPYVGQHTENIPKSLKLNANSCKKVNKQISEKDIKTGRFKRQAMDCFVCEDPKTGSNYEQCSYSSEPENEDYFVGTAEKFSQPASPLNFRYKREAKKPKDKKKQEEEEEYVNPYDYVKSQSHKYYSTPEEFASTQYNPKDFGAAEEYRFGPEFFADEDEEVEQEKSYSEKQADALKKNPENCKKVKKGGMTCMICKNEKTGGNYEQCSYTSAPAEKKYAYVRERKFDKDDNPIEDKVTESSEPEEQADGTETEEKHLPKRRFRPTKSAKKEESRNDSRRSRSRYNPRKEEIKKSEDSSYEIPSHFEKSTSEQKSLRGLDPKLYSSDDSAESSEKESKKAENYETPDLEEYTFKLFPNYNKQETKKEEKRVKVPDQYKSFEAEETKKDVEDVLAEFAKKDRSSCKKAQRHGMTCYLCIDKKGIENEECMYVSESQPKSSHVAYHEVQKVKSPKRGNQEDGAPSESKIKESEQTLASVVTTTTTASPKRRRVFKKPTTESPKEIVTDSYRSSTKIESTTSTIAPKRITRRLRRTKNVSSEEKKSNGSKDDDGKVKIVKRKAEKEEEPTLKTPEEFQVGSEEGAYSLETKPVYSKQFGGPLPKYMVEKTEYEVDFDKFSHS